MADINLTPAPATTDNPAVAPVAGQVGENRTDGVFNPNINTPGTQGDPIPLNKPALIAPQDISSAPGIIKTELMNNGTNKTFYQEGTKLFAPMVTDFVSKISNAELVIEGKYKEFGIILPPKGVNYSREAFIPSAVNVASVATSIRRDIDKLTVKKFRIKTVDADNDYNMVQYRIDIRKDLYADKFASGKLDSGVNESAGTMLAAIELNKANKAIQGYNAVVEGNTVTQNGLTQIIAAAKSDAQSNLVDSATLTRYVVYKPQDAAEYKAGRLEALAQLNMLIGKASQPNTKFSFYGSALPTQLKEKVIVLNNKMFEAMKAANLNYFKDIETLFNTGSAVQVPETTFDVNFVAGSDAPVSTIVSLDCGLADDEILLMDKSKFIRFTNGPVLDAESAYAPNNNTLSMGATAKPSQDYLPDGSVIVYKAPVLINQFAFPVSDINV